MLGVTVGVGVGVSSSPPAKTVLHTEFIKVPEYKTKVVTKEVQLPPPPLPSSCRDAVSLLPTVVAQSDIQTNAAGSILLALEDLGTGTAAPDIHEINQATETIRIQRSRLGNTVLHQHDALNKFKAALEQCNTDLGD